MRHKLLRSVLALLTFAVTVQWSREAQAAPLTITGTVGEIGEFVVPTFGANIVRFKLTNVNATAPCTDQNMYGVLGYAWFYGAGTNSGSDPSYREWYTLLLYSKKGAPISCVLSNDGNDCHVTSCTLP